MDNLNLDPLKQIHIIKSSDKKEFEDERKLFLDMGCKLRNIDNKKTKIGDSVEYF